MVTDRYTTILASVVFLLVISFCIYTGLHIHTSEIQIVTHYTAFGVTNFYHDRWYYLLSFVAFGIIVAIAHIILMAKLYTEKNRVFALAFGWLTVALIVIAWIIIAAILRVAFPL